MDIFAELKKRADREIEWIKEEISKTDDSYKKFRYRKIRVGIEAMLEHIYEVEKEYKKQTVKTNADKIRSMSDKELAEHFSELIKDTRKNEYCAGVGDWLQWLKSEAE